MGKMLMRLLSSEKTKKNPKKNFPLPQYFKMMVLLLYIQNQDKQKNDQKKSNQVPRKKKIRILLLPKTTPKNPSTTTKNFATRHNFFLQVMNKNTRKNKKNNQKKTKQAREKEIMFLFFDPEVPKKRLQLSCKIQGNTKSKLTRKTKILQKNPMKYTHKKVELKKKKSSEKKPLLPFSFFAVQQLVKLT